MTIYRVCPTCGMLTPVVVIGEFFRWCHVRGKRGSTKQYNGYVAKGDYLCSGCNCVLVKR